MRLILKNNRHYIQIFSILSIIFFAVIIFAVPHSAKAIAIEPIQQVLTKEGGLGHTVKQVWQNFLSFANSVMVLALLVIAFSNILHIQIDKYAIKKILPSLVMAIVLANFSYFICRAFIDLGNMVLKFILEAGGGSDSAAQTILDAAVSTGTATLSSPTGQSAWWGEAWQAFFVNLGTIVGSIFVAILSYLFFIRNWVIYFLVALSPLGFIALSLPQTQTLFQTWWKQFLQWVFMPVVATFWLWVGSQFLAALGTSAGVMTFVFAIACFYFAFTTPFKLGGAIMKGWGGLGKRLMSSTGSAGGGLANFAKNRWVNPLVDDVKNRVKNWYGDRVLGLEKEFNKETGKWEIKRNADGTATMKRQGLARLLGWHYDRSKTIAINRQDRADRWTKIQNQMQANTMNKWSEKKQLDRQYYVDEANAFLGEIERTEADQRLKFLNTNKGVEALQRSLAYAKNMEGLQQGIKNMQTKRELEWTQESNNIINGEDGKPMLSGNGFWTRRHIHDQYLLAQEEAASLDLAARKKAFDIGGSQQDAAAVTDFFAVNTKAYLAEKKAIDEAEMSSESRRNAHAELDAMYQEIDMAQLQEMVEGHVRETEGRISPLLKKMLGDAVKIDMTKPEGERVTLGSIEQLAKIQTQGEAMGYKFESEERKIISDRAGKVLTNHAKDELATERDKRFGAESGLNVVENPYLMGALYNHWEGRPQAAPTWSRRDGFGRYENTVATATNYQAADFRNALNILVGQVRNLTKAYTDGSLGAVKGLIRENNSALSSAFSSVIHDDKFVAKVGGIYAEAAQRTGLSFSDESTFLAAKQHADAGTDAALRAQYSTLQAEIDQKIADQVLEHTEVDKKIVGGHIDLRIVRDSAGRASGVDLQEVALPAAVRGADGSINDTELKKFIANNQAMYEHMVQQMVRGGSRNPLATALFGGIKTHWSLYRNQLHSTLEKDSKNKAAAYKSVVDRYRGT